MSMSEEEFSEIVRAFFKNVDLASQGMEITVKGKQGEQKITIPDNVLKNEAKKVGVAPETVDKIKQLPPGERQMYALKLLYRLMQNEEFKSAFFQELKERGVIDIPDTKENISFMVFLKYFMLTVILGLIIIFILALGGYIS